MRNAILMAVMVVVGSAGPASAQKGNPAKLEADAAKAEMDLVRAATLVTYLDAVDLQLSVKALDKSVREERWNGDAPGKAWYAARMTPEQYGTTLGFLVQAYVVDYPAGAAYRAAGEKLDDGAYADRTAGDKEYAAGQYQTAAVYYGLSRIGYKDAGVEYGKAYTSFTAAGVGYTCAQALMDLYPNP